MKNETPENTRTAAPPLEWHEGDMPYSTAFGDHFYCREDGRAECAYVFLDANKLPERWLSGGAFVIGELGFGTGLNFCETWRQWKLARPKQQQPGSLHFISHELFPMQRDDIDKALARWPEISDERQALTNRWPDEPEGMVSIDFGGDVRLSVVCGDALSSIEGTSQKFDAWYLDGFAPTRNPAMWSPELMAAVYDHTVPGGTFGTYAAAGFVRRNLQAACFQVERRPGYAGKREMLFGRRP